ncbi:MAG: hypothetical protein KC502_16675 [Myxococcales bacterium]|nr:hypothetical protein [Myxococcales bacterium]
MGKASVTNAGRHVTGRLGTGRRAGWALPVVGMAILALTTACGADETGSGTCSETTSTGLDKKAEASLNDQLGAAQKSYSFDANATAKKSFAFVLTNTASALSAAPLKVTALSLTERDSAGKEVSEPLFVCKGPTGKPCAAADFPAVIPSGFTDKACTPAGAKTGADFQIIYTHKAGASARKLKIRLELSGDPDRTAIEVDIATALGKPKFTCQRTLVDFGTVKANGDPQVDKFTCHSVGTAPVTLKRAELFSTTQPPLSLTVDGHKVALGSPYTGTPSVVIAPSDSIELVATLASLTSEEKVGATLKLTTDDFTEPVRDVQFKANSSGPCLKPSPSAVAFGQVGIGQPKPMEVQLAGCGTEAVNITKISLKAGTSVDLKLDFTTGDFTDGKSPTEAIPLVVQPNSSASFRVICTPSEVAAKIAGTIVVESSNTDSREIAVTCEPAKLVCPVACIDPVAPAGAIVPQTKLTLSSNCSKAGAGQVIDKRIWSVVQPGGSFASFSPNNKDKQVSFLPNVAGDYTFKLQVFDDLGNPGCTVAETKVPVLPDNKLHVELTWETKGDPKKGDDKGPDLDLHLTHPKAKEGKGQPDLDGNGEPDPWYAKCYDTFWLNPNPGWGDAFDINDNPSVDLDDKNGEGPENISVKVPETNIWYTVGAYYWEDFGMGPSRPRVRIYIDKELVFNKLGPLLKQGDMWCAGEVAYDPKAVTLNAKAKLIRACKGADNNGNLVTAKYPPINPAKSLKCD